MALALTTSDKQGTFQGLTFIKETLESAKNKSIRTVIFSKTDCKYCTRAKHVLNGVGVAFQEVNLTEQGWTEEQYQLVRNSLRQKTNMETVPVIFIDGKLLGGCDALLNAFKTPAALDDLYPDLIQLPEFIQAVKQSRNATKTK